MDVNLSNTGQRLKQQLDGSDVLVSGWAADITHSSQHHVTVYLGKGRQKAEDLGCVGTLSIEWWHEKGSVPNMQLETGLPQWNIKHENSLYVVSTRLLLDDIKIQYILANKRLLSCRHQNTHFPQELGQYTHLPIIEYRFIIYCDPTSYTIYISDYYSNTRPHHMAQQLHGDKSVLVKLWTSGRTSSESEIL